MSELKTKVVHGAFWVLLQRFSTQFVSFFVTLVLARLLTPSDYGTVALLSIFTQVAGILVDSGLGMALVQKKDATDLDFNSMFFASIAASSIAYGVLFVAAPYIAAWYEVSELKWMLRLISVSLIFGAMNSVQSAELSRKMLFNLSFRISLITCFTSAIVGASLAYLGYGPWAIAWQGVITGFVGVCANWIIIAWRPRWMFSWSALKGLFSFGWKVTGAGVIDTIYTNAYGIIIGKAYTREDLAFVNKGQSTPELLMSSIVRMIWSVSFPALSAIQDDRVRVRAAVKRMLCCSAFFVFPLMTGLALCADDVVFLLFGTKWLPCVPYMQLACFNFFLSPFHGINLQVIMATGRSDIYLKIQFIKTGLGCVIMAIFLSQSVFLFMAAMAFVQGPCACYINAWHTRKSIGYSLFQQVKDTLPMIGVCIGMSLCVMGVRVLLSPHSGSIQLTILKVVVQVIVGASVYVVLSAVFKIPALSEYARILLPKLGNKLPRLALLLNKVMI